MKQLKKLEVEEGTYRGGTPCRNKSAPNALYIRLLIATATATRPRNRLAKRSINIVGFLQGTPARTTRPRGAPFPARILYSACSEMEADGTARRPMSYISI